MVKILMISEKMAAPALIKVKVFWNKGYYVIYSVDDVTNKICHMTRLMYRCGHVSQSLVTLAFA